MKFCPYCGNYNNANGNFCESCGATLKNNNFINNNVNNYNNKINEGSTIGWGLLGFFIPIVGVVLFLVWHTERPKSAKSAGIGALVRVIISIILVFIFIAFLIITEPNYEKRERYNYPYETREKYHEDDWT